MSKPAFTSEKHIASNGIAYLQVRVTSDCLEQSPVWNDNETRGG